MAYYLLFYAWGLKRLCRRVANLMHDKCLKHENTGGMELESCKYPETDEKLSVF